MYVIQTLILPPIKDFGDKKSEKIRAVNYEEVQCFLEVDINQLTLNDDNNPAI